MRVSYEEKKAEALERMQLMGLPAEQIEAFRKEGMLRLDVYGASWQWVDAETMRKVRILENDHRALFYLGIRSRTPWGTMVAWPLVSDYREDWPYEREKLSEQAYCWVENETVPDFSEPGSVGYCRNAQGILERTW